MSVQIVINGENANEAIQELAALSAGIAGRSVPAEAAPAPESPKTERSTRAARTKPEPTKAPPAAPREPEDEPVNDEPETDDSDASDEPIPTDVELRGLARKIGALLAQLAYELKDDESLDPKVRGLLAEIWRSFEHYI